MTLTYETNQGHNKTITVEVRGEGFGTIGKGMKTRWIRWTGRFVYSNTNKSQPKRIGHFIEAK